MKEKVFVKFKKKMSFAKWPGRRSRDQIGILSPTFVQKKISKLKYIIFNLALISKFSFIYLRLYISLKEINLIIVIMPLLFVMFLFHKNFFSLERSFTCFDNSYE